MRTTILFSPIIIITCWASACATDDPAYESGKDGFSGGSAKLALRAAPPGLCDGYGSQKECEDPNGCEPEPGVQSESYAGGGYVPTSIAPSGGAGGSGYYSAPTAGTGGSGYYPGYAGAGAGEGGASGNDQVLDAGVVDSGGSGIEDAGDCEPGPDGGLAPGCQDAGEPGLSRNALIAEDVPGCDTLDYSEPYTLYMSADDSNSMASPVMVRRMIRAGYSVGASLVRPHEFLNYYNFSFEPAAPGEVRVFAQLSSCPQDGQLSFQVALQAEVRTREQRAPLNITLVLDTSGSMGSSSIFGPPTPIELERAAVLAIASELKPGDVVSMVTWSEGQNDILTGHQVSGPDDPVIVDAANALQPGGSTDLAGGLNRGYTLAHQYYSPERINRVVLISDGQANVGVTDEELIGKWADDEEGEAGIYLAGIGVGDGYDDTLMDVVTDTGRGAYVYIDSVEEARRMLGKHLLQVVDLAARAVRLEVTLPWYLALEKFYGEVVSTDPTKVRPQHLAPNDAMLFFQVLNACDPPLLHGDDRIRIRATWETPFEREQKEKVIDTVLNDLAGDDANLTKAAAIAGYAEALILADQDPAGRESVLQKALDDVLQAKNSDTDPDLLEVADLIRLYMQQQGSMRYEAVYYY